MGIHLQTRMGLKHSLPHTTSQLVGFKGWTGYQKVGTALWGQKDLRHDLQEDLLLCG